MRCSRSLVLVLALTLACAGCAGLWGFDDLTAGDAGSAADGDADGLADAIGVDTHAEGPSSSAYVAAVLADTPIAYWRLDETSGMTARDSSGHGNDATYIGGVHPGTAGAIANDPDTAATFDGATGYMDGGNRFAFAGAQPFSLEAWVRASSSTSYLGIASREDTSGGPPSEGYVLFVSPSDGVFGYRVSMAQVRPRSRALLPRVRPRTCTLWPPTTASR